MKHHPLRLAHIAATTFVLSACVISTSMLYLNSDMHAQLIDPSLCGNGNKEVSNGEQCDDGREKNGTVASFCTTECQHGINTPDNTDAPSCGNGEKEGTEECDDGGNNSDTAANACRTSCKQADCRDGVVDNGEECDDGNENNEDGCTNYCKEPDCGDGITQESNNEECDDANGDDADGCTNDCKNPICGDGITQESRGEECDDGENNDDAHECTSNCKKAYCGDSIKQSDIGEECDAGPQNGASDFTCTSNCKTREVTDDEDDGGTLGGVGGSDDEDDGGTIGGVGGSDDNDDGDSTLPLPKPEEVKEKVLPAAPTNEEANQQTDFEELRRKTEEQRKKFLEAQKRAEEEARAKAKAEAEAKAKAEAERVENSTENENDRDVEDVDNEIEEVDTAIEPKKAPETDSTLRCFDADGNIIADRAKCDREREQMLRRPIEDVPEEEVQEELRRKLLGDNNAEQKRLRLVETMTNARIRLERIYGTQQYDAEVQQYLGDAIEWLKRGITYFSVSGRSIEEVQQMTEPVRQLIEQASTLIQQKGNLPTERPDINPIIEKTERLMLKFRSSFIALAQGRVTLNQEALQNYTEAANLFEIIKGLCIEDADQCSRLDDVLVILKKVQGPLQESLEQNPEIYRKVQEEFEQ